MQNHTYYKNDYTNGNDRNIEIGPITNLSGNMSSRLVFNDQLN